MLCALTNLLLPSPYKCVFCTIFVFFSSSLKLILTHFIKQKIKQNATQNKLWQPISIYKQSRIRSLVFGLDLIAPHVDSSPQYFRELLITIDVVLDLCKEGCQFVLLFFWNRHAFCYVYKLLLFSGFLLFWLCLFGLRGIVLHIFFGLYVWIDLNLLWFYTKEWLMNLCSNDSDKTMRNFDKFFNGVD